ncbi:hypothetical protein F5Y04DRAFT_127693 [Hypomontagnella monticulosa]|nr:hypothetical protein F5Y04DRAFT_127693 [Hypomontagnella monticulosa]
MPRGVSPAPLNIGGSGDTSHRRQDSYASSYYSEKEKDSPRSSHFEDCRKLLSNHSSQNRKSSGSSKPHSPTVNGYTYCGRHSDQYLFSGWSNIKSAFKKD